MRPRRAGHLPLVLASVVLGCGTLLLALSQTLHRRPSRRARPLHLPAASLAEIDRRSGIPE